MKSLIEAVIDNIKTNTVPYNDAAEEISQYLHGVFPPDEETREQWVEDYRTLTDEDIDAVTQAFENTYGIGSIARLIYMCKTGNLDAVMNCIQNGADIHANNDLALRMASGEGHLEVVKYLVEQGADIHGFDNQALIWASGEGHLQVVQYLIEQGADIHADDDGALKSASINGHLDVVQCLVENGADIHSDHDLAFRHAAENGHLEVVQYFVDQGADIHAECEIYDTALEMAARYENFQVCDYLVSLGCDPQKVIDNESIENKEWAYDFVEARDFANKLTNDLGKADKLVSSINHDAEAPAKQSRSTRQKI
ncbi:ankyrin repeat domain-containing protein [Burkholderia contaminans]|uniref:ankyrin repeat domain-containing protein n=1 Tax=Burkholderia contaminans TaxID=488447 RepID=UPI0015885868|nr:ankyrin repeat domain-containing protein [Burkholderia contaminans]